MEKETRASGLKLRGWILNAILALAVFAVNAWLNTPLFQRGEMPYRDSIEGGYSTIARFVAEHPNPWGWNPTAYCGVPTQFTYLPALPYLAAALGWVWNALTPAYAHRLITGTAACLVPVSVFLFVLYFTKKRWWALVAALAYTLFSPLYGLIPAMQLDKGLFYLPWRLQVLVKYGEGPHTVGLMLLPLALVAAWKAGTTSRYPGIFVAALLFAAIALTNWLAAFACAIACSLLLLTGIGARRDTGFRAWPVIAAAALAYLLASFWLTPAFVRTTLFNWPVDSFNYQLAQQQWTSLACLVVATIVMRVLFLKLPGEVYLCFVTLCLLVFGWIVIGHYWFKVSTIPESRRYAVEFALFLLLALIEWFRLGLASSNRVVNACVVLPALIMIYQGQDQVHAYLFDTRSKWRIIPKERTVEYQVAEWLNRQKPAGRVFATGGLRFRMNSWFRLPQTGGTFESGLRNRMPVEFATDIRTGAGSPEEKQGANAVLQLRAQAVEYVVVHGPGSAEHWKDVKNHRKFEGILPRVFDDGDDEVFRLPFHSYAHLVRPNELPSAPPVGDRVALLESYVAAMDDASRPRIETRWLGANDLELEGTVPAGMLVAVRVTHEEGWSAHQNGRRLVVERDKMGFMVVHAESGENAKIRLHYGGTVEQRAMAGVSALAWIASLGALGRYRRKKAIEAA
jgi:hypothetical protein